MPKQKQTASFYDKLDLADSANKIFKSDNDDTSTNSSSSETEKVKLKPKFTL